MEKFFDWYLWYFIYLAFFEFILISNKRAYCADHPGLSYDEAFDYRCNKLFAIMVFLPLFFISSYRTLWMGDTGAYVSMFKSWPNTVSEITFDGKERYPGFIVFSVLIKQCISTDFRIWLIIIAAIVILCLSFAYRKHSSELALCAFLFFASSDFHSWMMNGMRQFLVVAILFAATPLLFKKKFIWFILLGVLLYTFHVSVIIALPIYFIVLGKPFNKRTLLVLAAAFVVLLFINRFTDIFVDVVSTTNYSESVKEMVSDKNNGTNIIRVLVYSVPGVMAIIFRKKIPEDAPVIINYSLNMSLMTTAFYMVSVFTTGIFFGRMPIYFSLFNYILLPWELHTFFEEKDRKMVYLVMIVLYLAFFAFQMHTWGI